MSIVFRNRQGQAIKTWCNMEYSGHGMPMAGDVVLLHWGDHGGQEEAYRVVRRIFDGRDMGVVVLIVERYEESED